MSLRGQNIRNMDGGGGGNFVYVAQYDMFGNDV